MVFISSRVARKPIEIPPGITLTLNETGLVIKGPKGSVQTSVNSAVSLLIEKESIKVLPAKLRINARQAAAARKQKAITGTQRANIANAIQGVLKGFEKKLLLVGVGYRAQVKDNVLTLSVGFAHVVNLEVPKTLTVQVPIPTEILVLGLDKHLVGHFADKIRSVRPPERYKGKGIRYANEVIILKETKKNNMN